MREGEDLGGVCEWHGALTGRIEGIKQEDEESNETDMSGARLRNEVGESCSQKGPGHLGESEQEKGSSSIGINGPDGRPGETSRTCQFRRVERDLLRHTRSLRDRSRKKPATPERVKHQPLRKSSKSRRR